MPKRKLTQNQLEEFIKCRNDPVYFITKYGNSKGNLGIIPWDKPYPYQVDFWKQLHNGLSVIVNKTRQIGCSWAAAAYAVWMMIFRPDVEILLLSEKEQKAIRLLNNAKFFFYHLPGFLQPTVKDNSKTRFSVRFAASVDGEAYVSESSIDSLTLTPRNAAGYTAALIVFDEAAHVDGAEEVFTASKPAISHGGQMAVISTPGGINNFFFRLWSTAQRELDEGKTPGFVPIEAYWRDCGLTEEWFEQATSGMTKQQILQEYEMQFLTSGSPFFDLEQLEKCYMPDHKFPEIKDAQGNNMKIRTKMSFTGVDSAQGNRTNAGIPDYTSMVTLNEFGIQIDCWHSNDTPIQDVSGYTMTLEDDSIVDVEGLVSKWHKSYRGAMVIETFGPGDVVFHRQRQRTPNDPVSYVLGRQTTRSSKQRMLNTLRVAIAGQQVIITDRFTYDCMMAFEDKGNGKYEAADGFFDDPVIALALAYSELNRFGGFLLELGSETTGGVRMVAVNKEEDVGIGKLDTVLPIGNIVSGPIFEEVGDRLTDQIDEWRTTHVMR